MGENVAMNLKKECLYLNDWTVKQMYVHESARNSDGF